MEKPRNGRGICLTPGYLTRQNNVHGGLHLPAKDEVCAFSPIMLSLKLILISPRMRSLSCHELSQLTH
jgi:hypothetical protein